VTSGQGRRTLSLMPRRDRRYAVTQLAKDVPPGPQGQPGHKAGAEVVLITAVDIKGLGGTSFPTPRPSELLLHESKSDLARAVRLRTQSLRQINRPKWTQPGIAYELTNSELLFDFLGAAMIGVVQAYTAVDARLNEFFTDSVSHQGQSVPVEQVQGYWSVDKKLEYVTDATGATWFDEQRLRDELEDLKALRDMIVHVRTDTVHSRHPDFLQNGGEQLLWHRLLNDSDLERFGRLAEELLNGLQESK
jgi:hypothetical protein